MVNTLCAWFYGPYTVKPTVYMLLLIKGEARYWLQHLIRPPSAEGERPPPCSDRLSADGEESPEPHQ
jgi:hypothetical protein